MNFFQIDFFFVNCEQLRGYATGVTSLQSGTVCAEVTHSVAPYSQLRLGEDENQEETAAGAVETACRPLTIAAKSAKRDVR